MSKALEEVVSFDLMLDGVHPLGLLASGLDNSQQIDRILLDFSKAFDTAPSTSSETPTMV